MNAARAVLRRVFGLFVDDSRFAGSIILWLALSWPLLAALRSTPDLAGFVLFAGFALILMAAAIGRARRATPGTSAFKIAGSRGPE